MAEDAVEKDEIEVVEEEEQLVVEAEAEAEAESAGKEEELENYSKSVQNRISKLTQRYREEEFQRKAALNLPKRSKSRTKS